MADEQQQAGGEVQQVEEATPMIAPFPAPPPFYQHFTARNLAQLRQKRKEAHLAHSTSSDNGDAAKKELDMLSLPTELRYLIPPQPPTTGEFTVFGVPTTLEQQPQSLAERGVEQLFPDRDSVYKNPQPQLIALARSLLTTFLSLLGILSQSPELWDEQTYALRHICENMHALINGYRPHQARETLILMMEERIAQKRDEIRRINEGRAKTQEILQRLTLGVDGMGGAEMEGKSGVSHARERACLQRQKDAWASLQQGMTEE